MEVEQLKYFLMVAQYQHFTLAAEQLCISQSALSKQIRALESELGVPLLDRCGRSVHVTSAGQDFLIFAQEVVASYNKLRHHLNQYKNANEGHVTIGTIPIISQYGFHSVLATFMKAHPEIKVEIVEERCDQILNLLDNGQIDFAILRTATLPHHPYKIVPLVEDVMVLVTHQDHPLARRPSVDLSEASKESFILPDIGRGLEEITLQACFQAGFRPNILFRSIHIQSAIGFIAENMGVSLLMRKAAESFKQEGIRIVPLNDPIKSTLALVFPHGKKLSPSASMLRAHITKRFS